METVVQLLAGVALASDQAASMVMAEVVPVLLSQYSSSSQVSLCVMKVTEVCD